MHHNQARRRCEFNGEVAVAHRVKAVLAYLGFAMLVHHVQSTGHASPIKRVGGARQGGRAQRQAVDSFAHVGQAFSVSRQHFHIGQQVVSKTHGLGYLQVGKARKNDVYVAFSHVQ